MQEDSQESKFLVFGRNILSNTDFDSPARIKELVKEHKFTRMNFTDTLPELPKGAKLNCIFIRLADAEFKEYKGSTQEFIIDKDNSLAQILDIIIKQEKQKLKPKPEGLNGFHQLTTTASSIQFYGKSDEKKVSDTAPLLAHEKTGCCVIN